jgi:hypothetical protein
MDSVRYGIREVLVRMMTPSPFQVRCRLERDAGWLSCLDPVRQQVSDR